MPRDLLPSDVQSDIPRYTHQQILRVITGIMLCIFLSSLDQTVIIPAVPAMAADLNAFGHLAWIVTAYLLTSTAATPIIGKLSDIWGRRALLVPSLILFIVASMACGFAQSLPQLIVFRAIQGLGGAGLMSMSQAAIADVVAPRERGRYQGYMASMWGVSSIAGPIVGGWVTDHLSWRWIFWANLPIGLVALFLCNRALKMIRTQKREVQIDYIGSALLVGGVTALLLMLSWGGVELPWSSAPVIALALASIGLIAALIWQERRAADPVLPPRLFANRTFFCGVLIAFFTSLGLFGATFLLPLSFQLVLGFDAETSGLLVMPFLASSVIGAFVGGQFARRIGRTKGIVLVGLLFCVVGFLGLMVPATSGVLMVVLPASAVVGIGIGVTMPSVLMQVQNAAEQRDVGAATGSLLFLRSMGGAFGSTIVGSVLTTRFNAGLATAGLPPIDLGALRGGELGATLVQARAALASGFSLAFGVCFALLIVAVLIAAVMRDIPLRSGTVAPREIAH
ncbi:MAG: MFS transporter [Pseudomonadota bacterium]|nr:MFS transporter [Pseudomonadota bacterium]